MQQQTPQAGRKYLRPHEAAAYLGLAASTIAKMRMSGDGPTFIKAGPKVVLYDQKDLDAWLENRKRISTMEDA